MLCCVVIAWQERLTRIDTHSEYGMEFYCHLSRRVQIKIATKGNKCQEEGGWLYGNALHFPIPIGLACWKRDFRVEGSSNISREYPRDGYGVEESPDWMQFCAKIMNSFTFTLVRSRGGTGGAEGDVMFIPEYLEHPLFILFIANLDSSWLQHHHHVWFNWRWNFLFSLFISFTFIHGKYQNRTWNKQNSHFHRYTFRLSRTLFAHLHFLSWLVALLFYFFLPQLMDLTTFSPHHWLTSSSSFIFLFSSAWRT